MLPTPQFYNNGSGSGGGSNWMNALSNLGGGVAGYFGGQNMGNQYDNMGRQIQQGIGQQQQYTDQANQRLMPFWQAGVGNLDSYQKNYGNLMDPNFINKLMGGYQTSDWAKHQMKEGNNAITNAASASGNLNSGQFGKNMTDYAQGVTSKDQGQWLDRILGQYGVGLGHQQGMVGLGANTGNQMGQNLIGMGDRAMQARLAQAMAQLQGSQARQGGTASLLSGLGGLAGSLFGGGPMGGALGSSLGGIVSGLFS